MKQRTDKVNFRMMTDKRENKIKRKNNKTWSEEDRNFRMTTDMNRGGHEVKALV